MVDRNFLVIVIMFNIKRVGKGERGRDGRQLRPLANSYCVLVYESVSQTSVESLQV